MLPILCWIQSRLVDTGRDHECASAHCLMNARRDSQLNGKSIIMSELNTVIYGSHMALRQLIELHNQQTVVLCNVCHRPLVFALTAEQAAKEKGPLGVY